MRLLRRLFPITGFASILVLIGASPALAYTDWDIITPTTEQSITAARGTARPISRYGMGTARSASSTSKMVTAYLTVVTAPPPATIWHMDDLPAGTVLHRKTPTRSGGATRIGSPS